MKFLIIFVTLVLYACQIHSLYLNDADTEEGSGYNEEIPAIEGCEEQICARIYNPVCVFVDGKPINMTSRCHAVNLRCKMINYALENKGALVPKLTILYGGECD